MWRELALDDVEDHRIADHIRFDGNELAIGARHIEWWEDGDLTSSKIDFGSGAGTQWDDDRLDDDDFAIGGFQNERLLDDFTVDDQSLDKYGFTTFTLDDDGDVRRRTKVVEWIVDIWRALKALRRQLLLDEVLVDEERCAS